jgi:hypothetical protein
MTEETKNSINQFLLDSKYFEEIANNYGEDLLNEVVYAVNEAGGDTELVMSIFEDSGMIKHMMVLNDISLSK